MTDTDYDPTGSLADAFAPPRDGLVGVAALLCGFSASTRFLDQAMTRFTGLGRTGRDHQGQLCTVLYLDPHLNPRHSVIKPGDVAGLYQAFPKPEEKWHPRFELMHAKVALLGFASSWGGKPTQFRVIVSTGNWTESAASRDLDLVWHCDVEGSNAADEDRADLKSAVRFFRTLSEYFEPIGSDKFDNVTGPFDELTEAASAMAGRAKLANGRFLSSFDDPLLPQIVKRLKAHKVRSRNFIACGSGFFEQGDDADEPEVLKQIISQLSKAGVSTANPPPENKLLVINIGTCGAVLPWLRDQGLDNPGGWTICTPADPWAKTPNNAPRTSLHGKFIFLARMYNDTLSNGWLYLGSGNLSRQGFLGGASGSSKRGNVEAGVVVRVDEHIKRADLSNRLPIGEPLSGELPDESEKEEDEEGGLGAIRQPPPVIAFQATGSGREVRALWSSNQIDADVALETGETWTLSVGTEHKVLPGDGPLPQAVMVREAGARKEAGQWVPVFAEDGSYCRSPYSPMKFDDLLGRLKVYPNGQAEEDDEDDDSGSSFDEPETGVEKGLPGSQSADVLDRHSLPIPRAMHLVETVAMGNQNVSKDYLRGRADNIRTLLIEGVKPDLVREWQQLGINFLACLCRPGFAPPPTLNDSKLHDLYANSIHKVAEAWGLSDLPILGDDNAQSKGGKHE